MSQLMQLRQQIKAIGTIKKITHAMRLISMSSHSQLKRQHEPLENYNKLLIKLFKTLEAQTGTWKHPILFPDANLPQRTLYIIIGSQKGLCGNFNTALFNLCDRHIFEDIHRADYIGIGKKAIDYLNRKKNLTIIATYKNLNSNAIDMLSAAIMQDISHAEYQYTSIQVVSNQLKTFFLQQPKLSTVIPATLDKEVSSHREDLLWEQKPEAILDYLAHHYLETRIMYLLFQSLFAEHAARFISMDAATRNAENLMDTTKLQYNKLRQAKITKELTELTGSFQQR